MTDWACERCGAPVRPPGQMGRSWCRVCDEYLGAVELETVPVPGGILTLGPTVSASSEVEVLQGVLLPAGAVPPIDSGLVEYVEDDPFGYRPTLARCPVHLVDEPCPTCRAYIAAGL